MPVRQKNTTAAFGAGKISSRGTSTKTREVFLAGPFNAIAGIRNVTRTPKTILARWATKNFHPTITPARPRALNQTNVNISELVQQVGLENIRVQYIDESMTDISTNKRSVSKVTFETNALSATEVAIGLPKMCGLVLWIPRAKWPLRPRKPAKIHEKERMI